MSADKRFFEGTDTLDYRGRLDALISAKVAFVLRILGMLAKRENVTSNAFILLEILINHSKYL